MFLGFAMRHWVAVLVIGIVGYWLGTRGTFGRLPVIGGGAAGPVAG